MIPGIYTSIKRAEGSRLLPIGAGGYETLDEARDRLAPCNDQK
jgi:hypothetical protein